MHRITDARIPGVDGVDAARIARWATGIALSTNTQAWWHALWNRPVWTLGESATPIITDAVVYPHTGTLRLPDPDKIRRSIYAGRPSAKEKMAMIRAAEKSAENERIQANEKYLEDRRADALDLAESITTKRVSVMTR